MLPPIAAPTEVPTKTIVQKGQIVMAAIQGPHRSRKAIYVAPMQATIDRGSLIATFGEAITPMSYNDVDWIVPFNAANAAGAAARHAMSKAMTASRMGFPIFVMVAYAGRREAGEEDQGRPFARFVSMTDDVRWGMDGFQTSIPVASLHTFIPAAVTSQLTTFENKVLDAVRGWAGTVATNEGVALTDPLRNAIVDGLQPDLIYGSFGGIDKDGQHLPWSVRDQLPFAMHLLKLKLRLQIKRAAWSEAELLETHQTATVFTDTNRWQAPITAAVRDLCTWDRAHMVAWKTGRPSP